MCYLMQIVQIYPLFLERLKNQNPPYNLLLQSIIIVKTCWVVGVMGGAAQLFICRWASSLGLLLYIYECQRASLLGLRRLRRRRGID